VLNKYQDRWLNREVGVNIGNEKIETTTIIWAAGIQASEVNRQLGADLDHLKRVMIEPDLSIKRYPNVFVGGDQANSMGKNKKPLPALAPVALQQGRFIADTIIKDINGIKRRSFHYIDKGQLATIGRKKAILQIGHLQMSGFLAWLLWLIIHIYFLIGFKNKLFVILQWAYSYFTFRKGSRLIINRY